MPTSYGLHLSGHAILTSYGLHCSGHAVLAHRMIARALSPTVGRSRFLYGLHLWNHAILTHRMITHALAPALGRSRFCRRIRMAKRTKTRSCETLSRRPQHGVPRDMVPVR
jgi:hypothetical protein